MQLGLLAILFAIAVAPLSAGAVPVAVQLEIQGAIGPATSDYVRRGIAVAGERDAEVLILRMDTPGGLDGAMRSIIRDILAAPLPIVTHVAPGGARAASAGTYILYASHVAAMAPGTNLGAATPVSLGGTPDPGGGSDSPASKDDKKRSPKDGASAMERKMINDAAAYIQGLARLRGRNAEWAERAVREAVSLPAEEALEMNVIDLVAADTPALLTALDGRSVTITGTERVLTTRDAIVETLEPDWRNRLLAVISDPNVAYILMLIGIYGLFFEFVNPGFVLPGVAGAIALLLALYAFQVLPINYAGVGLILLGIMFMVGEIFAPSFGALGLGGVLAFVAGSVILFDPGGDFAVSRSLIGTFAVLSAAFFMGVAALAYKAQRRPTVSGREQLLGSIGEALADFTGAGRVRVQGEEWQAYSEKTLRRGDKVYVTGLDGLVLLVQPMVEMP